MSLYLIEQLLQNSNMVSPTTNQEYNEIRISKEMLDDFNEVVETSHSFQLTAVEVTELQQLRNDYLKRQKNRLYQRMGLPTESVDSDSKGKNISSRKVVSSNSNQTKSDNVTSHFRYFYILLPYAKRHNSFCGICVRQTYFAKRTGLNDLILRCNI